MDINNAVVLVTGASSGIGAATARSASRAGAKVVLLARREDRLRQLAEELGEALPVCCDVTDVAQVAIAVRAAVDRFGRIDVARTELATVGIAVSTMYPFITATDFLKSLQTGHEMASQLEASHAPQPDTPERVAEAILDLIRTGAERADRVPEKFGGTLKD